MIPLTILPQAKGVTMIEIIQDGQATPRIKLPRNLRQIGNPSGEHKIYVEDFVYTFLHPSSREEAGNPKVAIIVGTQEEEHGTQYYFVRGAFYIDDMTFEKGLPQFSEEHWGFAYKQMKEYFDDEDPDKALQILGWAFVTGGMPARLTSDMERVHRMNFKEPHSLLLLLDDVEREENFYVYEKGSLRKKEGYYIFYEQNPKMQEYMVQYKEAKNPAGVTETVLDEPTGSYRERIATQARPGRGRWSMVGYAACAVVVLSTLVMGVNSIGRYEKINELQEAVSLIAGNFTQNEAKQAKDNDKTIVTTVDGKVEPLEDTAKEDTAKDNQSKEKSETDKKKAKDGENSENKQDVAQNDKKESQNAGESSEQSSEEVQETAAQPQSEAEKILAQGYYIVQSGDSLESISTKIYGNKSRVERIKELNQIENADTIFAGQKLNLP